MLDLLLMILVFCIPANLIFVSLLRKALAGENPEIFKDAQASWPGPATTSLRMRFALPWAKLPAAMHNNRQVMFFLRSAQLTGIAALIALLAMPLSMLAS